MNKIKGLLIVILTVILLLPFGSEETRAAVPDDYYENAITFYNNVKDNYHCEFSDMNFYYATRAKKGKLTKKRYGTIGWRITVTGNGQSMYIDVARNQEDAEENQKVKDPCLEHVHSDDEGNYNYNLYKISYDDICTMMKNKDSNKWNSINEASIVRFSFTAILSIKMENETNTVSHVIAEDKYGNVTFDNMKHVYYVGTDEGLKGIMEYFPSTDFSPYYEIQRNVANCPLTISYNVNGGTVSAKDYSAQNNVLYYKGSAYEDTGTRFGFITTFTANDLGLTLTGYKLKPGAEWTNSCNVVYGEYKTPAAGKEYFCSNLNPNIAKAPQSITLTANWVPITYSINYDSNNGSGASKTETQTYDTDFTIKHGTDDLAFRTDHYTFKEWNTKADGSGTPYKAGEIKKNLTAEDGKTITLYAIWEPVTYKITIDPNGGKMGTSLFYEKFGVQFSSDMTSTNKIDTITLPTKTGYTLEGLYESLVSKDNPIINIPTDGSTTATIRVQPNHFKQDTEIHAHWRPNNYTVTFDKQGGTGGTSTATATYDAYYPNATAPTRTGYIFLGYYTEKNGGGTLIYDENMACGSVYTHTKDTTLYAHWEKNVYTVTLNNQGATESGTPAYYLMYDVGNYVDKDCTTTISKITIPTKYG